jgi:hypothetical protein
MKEEKKEQKEMEWEVREERIIEQTEEGQVKGNGQGEEKQVWKKRGEE